jgi:hypothetical protein
VLLGQDLVEQNRVGVDWDGAQSFRCLSWLQSMPQDSIRNAISFDLR